MATTTTNNGWDIPQSTDLVKNGATAIATLGQDIDTSVGTGLLAWTAYTPTLTNFTLGTGGTVTCAYAKLGKIVHVRIDLLAGTSPSITGTPTISLPVTAAANYVSGRTPLNTFDLLDGSTNYGGHVRMGSTTTVTCYLWNASGSYTSDQAVSSTIPAASWYTSGDRFLINLTYEAA